MRWGDRLVPVMASSKTCRQMASTDSSTCTTTWVRSSQSHRQCCFVGKDCSVRYCFKFKTHLSLSLSFSPHSRQIPFEKTYIKSPSQKCAEYRPRIASLLNSLGPRRPNTGKAQDDPTTAIRNPRGSSNRRPGEAVRLEVHGIHGDPQPRRSDRKGRRWAKSGPWICLDEQQN